MVKRICIRLWLVLGAVVWISCGSSDSVKAAKVKVGLVVDVPGIEDQTFNGAAWNGMQTAISRLGVSGSYLVAGQPDDYGKLIETFIKASTDLIITVGFNMGDATAAKAGVHPENKFAIVDLAYDPPLSNVLGLTFATDQAAFLAGYLAAGITRTGKVGTFGGMQIPPVTLFMDGFALGVKQYNQRHQTNVQTIGWDPITQTGLFTGDFVNVDGGRAMGRKLIDLGVDIILPVAGAVGPGAAEVVLESRRVYIIGVDLDWNLVFPEYAEIVLTSVLKDIDVAVFRAIVQVTDGTFAGGTYLGTLANNGVDLAPFHYLDSLVPSDLKLELDVVRAGIIAETIKTRP
ncbi:MAG: BMP family ABC transporter substrate-binding protein [Deltaproteobacteria bacterium]|nr:BMP family ABC transporter substrate-binding protein [Deltaproteobacteria bacterium]